MSTIKLVSQEYTDDNYLAAKKNGDGSYNVEGKVVFENDVTTPAGDFATKADLDAKQDKLSSSSTVTVNADNTLSVKVASSVSTSTLPVTASAVNTKLGNYVNNVTSPDGSITVSKSGSNVTLKANGGGGGGTWYEVKSGSGVFFGPGIGDTPAGNGVLQIKSTGNMLLYSPNSVLIGPASGSGEASACAEFLGNGSVYFNGPVTFFNGVFDSMGREIKGGDNNPKFYNTSYNGLYIRPNETATTLQDFIVSVGSQESSFDAIEVNSGHSYFHSLSAVHIGPNHYDEKAEDVHISARNNIYLTVDDLTLKLDKDKLQRLIDVLNQ